MERAGLWGKSEVTLLHDTAGVATCHYALTDPWGGPSVHYGWSW